VGTKLIVPQLRILNNVDYDGAADALANLIYRLKLNESGGVVAADSSVNARDFVYEGAPTYQTPSPIISDIGGVILGGSPTRISRAYEAAINPAVFTALVWAKPIANNSTERTVFGSHSGTANPNLKGWAIQISSGNIWAAAVGSGTNWITTVGLATLPATVGIWRQLVFQMALGGAGTLTFGFYVGGRTAARGNFGSGMQLNPSGPSYLGYNARLLNYGNIAVDDAVLMSSNSHVNDERINQMLLYALGGPVVRSGSGAVSATGTVNVPLPAGTQDGDLMFLDVSIVGGKTLNAPAGWTPVLAGTSTQTRVYTYYKYAAGEPPGGYTFTAAGAAASAFNAHVLAIKNPHPTNPIDTSLTNNTLNCTAVPTVGPTLEIKSVGANRIAVTAPGPAASDEIDAKMLETNSPYGGTQNGALATFFRGVDTGGALPTQNPIVFANGVQVCTVSVRLKSPTSV
jgi:hypothetical protein